MTIFIRTTLLLLIALSFYGCAPKDRIISDKPSDQIDPSALDGTEPLDPTETAGKYMELASLSTGTDRNKHLLKAAEILLLQKQFDLAEQQLSSLNLELLGREESIDYNLLQAEIELSRGDARFALKLLNISQILSTGKQVRLMRLRARAFLDAGYPLESAKTRVQMDKLLTDQFDQELNHQAIWEALSLLPKTSLQQLSSAPLNADFLGWVELAKIAKRGQVDWQHLQDGIYSWRKEYPEHPAAKIFIKEFGDKQIELIEQPKHIAILLPLNGKYAQVAAAIRDGIMSSYYQHPDKSFQPQISFIDTSENQAAIWNYYKKASNQGADFIIGPFLKSAVDILAQAEDISIPTLTLNYASTQFKTSEKLFQFGLLPEDEARQSADMAFRQAHTHAAVLVPEGPWGERLRNAFQLRFEELGGTVVSTQTYTPNKNDFKKPIQNMLNIKQSYSRYRSIQNVMRTKMKFTPYRRQDVGMIFMAATPKDARQLKPQFKFHYAGEIPVYATSHAFTGQLNKQADRDIDDLNFLDMPWILNAPTKPKQSLINYWPEQQRYTRFFALGVDAYNLIPFLGRLQGKSYERFSGQTGNLYLDPFNRIHRELLPAQFKRGIPTLIDINTQPVNLTLDKTQPIQQPIN
ncbi:MAG: penicillin-binding protein activator [Gammaproteobacteria bacterium]|nr:penicillin-binding protein activator [Gammaproteobacteria bacterium]